MRRLSALVALLAACGLAPAPSSALSLAPDPVQFAIESPPIAYIGQVDLVGVGRGLPEGAVTREGAVSDSDTSLIFRLTLGVASDYIGRLHVAVREAPGFTLVEPTGAGAISGDGVPVQDVRRTETPQLGDGILFVFQDGHLDPGESSELVFVSFAAVSLGQVASFWISRLPPPGQMFGRVEVFEAIIVPEPATASLVLFGLFGIGRLRRPAHVNYRESLRDRA